MAIQRSALDLRHPRFRQAFAGVDPADVDALLDLAAECYEAAYAELDRLRTRHAEATRQLKQMYEDERAVSRVVIKAEEAAGEIREAAEAEIQGILEAAETRATAMTLPVEGARDALAREIENVQERHWRAAQVLEEAIGELEGRVEAPTPPAIQPLTAVTAAVPETFTPPAAATPASAGPAEREETAVAPPSALAAPLDAPAAMHEPEPRAVREDVRQVERIPESAALDVQDAAVPLAALEQPPLSRTVADGIPDAAEDIRTPEEKLRELITVRSHAAPEVGEPDSGDGDREAGSREDSGTEQGIGPSRRPWVLAGAAAAVLLIGAAAGLPQLARWLHAASTGSTLVAGERIDVPVLAASALPSRPAAARQVRTAPAPAHAERQAPLRLRLTASRECWLRITVDGEPQERVLAPGQAIMRSAERHIAVRVGDAGALAVELNGRSLPPLGGDGQVVNRVFRPSGS